MFNQREHRIDQSYLETYDQTAKTADAFRKVLWELLKALNEKWKEHQENKKIAVKVDEETYNLVEDSDTPGAYKWEKVDLNKDKETENNTETLNTTLDEFTEVGDNPWNSEPIQYSAEIEQQQPFTEYQAQTITTRLISFSPENSTEYNFDFSDEKPTIQITTTTESGETKVLYAQLENGEVVKNAFTEELSQEEIIDAAYEPLSQLLPPNSPLLSPSKDNIENIQTNNNKENLSKFADDMISKILANEVFEASEQLSEESATEIDEFTQINEIPNINKQNEAAQLLQYDADGLVLDENTTVKVNPNSTLDNTELLNETDEFLSLDEYTKQLEIEDTYETTNTQETSNLSNGATFIAGATATDVRINDVEDNIEVISTPLNQTEGQEELPLIAKTNKDQNTEVQYEITTLVTKKQKTEEVQEELPPINKKSNEQEEELSANYTYKKIASNPDVEPQAQQWARQSVISVYEIKHRGEKTKVEYENNKSIASSATEMLKKYGTIETDGSRIYRSDAFTVRKQNGVVSIHRRGDEAKGFKEPLMEFKLNKDGTPDIKEGNIINKLRGQTTQHNLSPVEKQEFLIVAERINEGKGLPDLQQTDTREMGNALGSLAPAGTLRTLQSFKETEVLGILNNALNQAKKDELKVGDFTIKRERDSENENRASLILTKDSNDGRGEQKLMQFDLEKTENGIESKVSKMNISDYDINQIKEISQNAYKRNQNLEMNFGTTAQQPSTKTESNTDTRNLGQVAVDIHPWVQKEWVQMVDDLQENPAHAAEIEEGLQEIKERMDKTPGKATIPEQCVMYDKIITHKTAMAQESNDPNATVSFMNKSDIIQDLKELRLEQINQQFTPTQNLTQKQAQAKQESHSSQTPTSTPRPTPRTKKEEIEV